ncbi:MAG TPA: alpha/beta fold hydrolase [Thermoanaerobaculia bacterium]|nr:alpha/beta fold hydrolase [Thermoanaerobaculia bacterium]
MSIRPASGVSHEVVHRRARTQDHVAIAYTWWRAGSPELLLLAPGFWRVRLARENLFLAQSFLRHGYDVVSFDFRGHGDSGGSYTFGASEALDLEAVVEQLVGEGKPYARFAVLGLSMGGSIAAEALARSPHWDCRALAMISSPADVATLHPQPWKAGAIRQVRLRNVFRMPRLSTRTILAKKPRAVEAISRLTMPKLIVTAEGDWLVDPSHGRMLADAAAPPVDYVHLEIPGSLHGDALIKYVPLRMLRLLHGWFARNAPGRSA